MTDANHSSEDEDVAPATEATAARAPEPGDSQTPVDAALGPSASFPPATGTEKPGPSSGSNSPDDLDYESAFSDLVARYGEVPTVDPHGILERPLSDLETRPEQESSAVLPAVAGQDQDEPDPWYIAQLDEHFEPEEPAALELDGISKVAYAGVIGGPAVLLLAALVEGRTPGWLILAAIAAMIAGFVTLIVRLPDERDDYDDGAVL